MFVAVVDREAVERAERSLAALCGSFDPELIPLPDATAVHASLAHMAELVDGALTLIARRVEESGSWRQKGHRSAEEQRPRPRAAPGERPRRAWGPRSA